MNTSAGEYFISVVPYILLLLLHRRKPPGDFEFAAHHCGIAAINGQINVFEHDKSIRSLHVVKEMYQRRPRAFRFNGGKNRLMIRRGLSRSNRGILDQ